MTCETARGQLMDVLYGEEVSPAECYRFFRHLGTCGECDREFREMLDVRDVLGQWNVDDPGPVEETAVRNSLLNGSFLNRLGAGMWPFLQRAAAVFLILVGGFSILQSMGFWRSDHVLVSEEQLMEMVNDLVVIRQAEERRIIGQALVNFAEEMSLQQRSDYQVFNEHLNSLEQRYLNNLEETNRYLKVLLSR